jgi:hypothetical protein
MMKGRVRRLRLAVLGAALVCSAVAAALLPAAAVAVDGPEWQHALWVAAKLRAEPPDGSVALLLGGSCAREATVNDGGWAADVQRLGGGQAETYNLGSRLQTFEQDVALVESLPKVPMVIYIGINAGRFASAFTTTTDTAPPATEPSFVRHHYHSSKIWTPERKQQRVRYWLDHRQAIFDDRYAAHLAQLDRLIVACVRRGYLPVVLALPRNIVAMDHALDGPTDRYLADSRRLAQEHGVAFLDFVPDLQLSDDDFYDLDHLVEPGRAVYQARLAEETARLFAADLPALRAGTETAGTGSAQSGGARPATQDRGGAVLWLAALGIVLAGFTLAALRRLAVVRRRRSHRRRRSGSRVREGA